MNRKYLLSVAAIAYLSNSVIADDSYRLDQVVVSASGFSQEIQEAPATMNVITKKELERKPYRDVAEAISDIPGVDLYASKGKSGAYNITMRGITGYTLVLVDGRRQGIGGEIGPNGFGEVMNAFLPPLSSIERIEVIKGPMSTLYGSEALGGVVNIITKKVSDEWGVSVGFNSILNQDTQWGNTYGYNIYADGPVIDNKLGAVFRYAQSYRAQSEVTHLNSRGQEVPATQAQSPTKANNYNVGARLNYLYDEANRFTFDIDYAKNHFDNRKSQIGTVGAIGGYEPTMDIDKLVTYLIHEGIYDGFSLNSGIQYNRVGNDSRLVVANNPYKGQNRDILAQDYIVDTKAVVPVGQSHILSVGAEYKLEKMQDKIASPSRFSQYTIAAFGEDEYSILNNLRLTLGARYNHHETFGNNLSPRAYLVYNLNDNLTFKGGVSTGFKAPYVNKLIAGEYNYSGQGRIPVYGNPNLTEETSINYELGAGYRDSVFNASITGFVTEFKDKISSVRYNSGDNIPSIGVCNSSFTRCIQAINHGKVEYKGLEVSAGVMATDKLNLNLSYTFLDSKIKDSSSTTSIGKPENGSLKHNIVAKADYNINRTFTPWVKGEWQIDRYMGDTNINREYYKDIFLASIGIAMEINKNWNLNAAIYNLFDKDFTDSYETYSSSSGALTYVNTYNRIEEGRRLYLSLNGRF
ncbi:MULTISPECIES: TonB-dependent ferric enterobactin receptor CfrA [Campylobacter]|uniref:TonB-dependent ferric enterobactin receptor CfrA n=1 Tax=Campylobacter TaxID=194 RepID=UPI000A344D88|nr:MULTISPECIES: TonB-dependent receptor [unclassified Campylobacter]MCR8678934.1 TonB-dependent receptor [Campylobacter sp. RM19072]MCR8696147.1 TonB-dependent receptor [Campylobacter sp. RM19073]